MIFLVVLMPLSFLQVPRTSPTRPFWSARLSVAGRPLTLKVWDSDDRNPEVGAFRGSRPLARRKDDGQWLDRTVRPRLLKTGEDPILAFATYGGTDDGQHASLWRLGGGGHRLDPLGILRCADLRRWPVVLEIRPAKYATDDMFRAFPNMWQEEPHANSSFVVAYRYECGAKRLRLVGVRLAREAETRAWPRSVRFRTEVRRWDRFRLR